MVRIRQLQMKSKPKVKWYIRWDAELKKFYLIDDLGGRRGESSQRPGTLAEFAFEHGADEVSHEYDLVAVSVG